MASIPRQTLKDRAECVNEWLRCVEPFKILIASLFGLTLMVFGWGVTYESMNNRTGNNTDGLKTEAAQREADIKREAAQREADNKAAEAARQADKAAVTARLDRGFDKVLDLVKEVRINQDNNAIKAGDDRAIINSRLGRIEGQLEERNREKH